MTTTYTIPEYDLPAPPDTIIKVGTVVDVARHGSGMTIERISVSLCPTRDIAAEGVAPDWDPDSDDDPPTAVLVPQIEAALLPYAVIDFGGHWAYGNQITAVHPPADG